MSSDLAISTHGLSKRFRRRLSYFQAVQDLTLEVPAGTTFGLLGPNGAGKTTSICMVLGLVRPDEGTSSVFGRSIKSPDTRRRVGFVPEKFQLPGYLTAQEFLNLHATLAGLSGDRRRQRVDEAFALVDLGDRRTDRLKGFSKGMQQRMVIAQAVLGEPDLLVLDEPTSALDPIGRREVKDLIRKVRERGTTVLLNSHLLAEVEEVCDRVAIMQHGRVLQQGTIAELADARVHVTMVVGGAGEPLREAVFRALDVPVTLTDAGDGGRHELRFTVEDDALLARAAAAVHDGGGELYSLVPSQERLEDLFLRLVGAGGAPQ